MSSSYLRILNCKRKPRENEIETRAGEDWREEIRMVNNKGMGERQKYRTAKRYI